MGKLDSSFTNKSLITNTSTGKDATTKEDKYVSQKVTVYGNDGGYSDRKVQNGNYITFYLDVPQGAGEQTKLIIKDLKIEINLHLHTVVLVQVQIQSMLVHLLVILMLNSKN